LDQFDREFAPNFGLQLGQFRDARRPDVHVHGRRKLMSCRRASPGRLVEALDAFA